MRWCVVVTHGRSGSTLLKDLLNTDAGCHIYGENNNFFYHLSRAHTAIEFAQGFSPGWSGPTDPWDGIEHFSPQRFRHAIRRMVEDVFFEGQARDLRLIGFKEIRFFADKEGFEMDFDDLPSYLRFLDATLSPVSFVHLTRDVAEVANSGWFRRPENRHLLDRIDPFNARIRSILSDFSSFEIDYGAIKSARSPELRALFDFLDLEFDQEKIARALSFKHGVGARQHPQPMAS